MSLGASILIACDCAIQRGVAMKHRPCVHSVVVAVISSPVRTVLGQTFKLQCASMIDHFGGTKNGREKMIHHVRVWHKDSLVLPDIMLAQLFVSYL